jgi:phosphohistidine phosphatase SixA
MRMVNKKMSLIITGACLFLAVTFAGAQQATQVKRIINTKSVVNKNLVNKQRNDDDIVAHSTVIFLSRHFEKEPKDTVTKQNKDPELSPKGKARAQLLASFLADKNVTTVFSTNYKRTIQTALPILQQNGLSVTFYNPRELPDFALHLGVMSTKGMGNILIVGHSNTTTQLLTLLGGPDKPLSENDYGDLFYLTLGDASQLKTRSVSDSFQHVMIE